MKYFTFLLLIFFACSCNNGDKIPDVSGISVKLETERFEKDLFDTSAGNLLGYMENLNQKNPSFTQNYLRTILNVDPSWPADTAAAYVNSFIMAYRPVFDSSQKIFSDFSAFEKEIKKGLQFVKYYFPKYKLPEKVITYIGPADGFGDAVAENALLVGLHHHLGKNFSLYKSELVQQVYPEYISNRFEPGYIAVNCTRNILDDIYPERESEKPLVNQMVEKGKKLYVLSKLLPYEPAYKLIGYTQQQYDDCLAHEKVIWDMFVKNAYLQSNDKNLIRNYLDEGPKTQELGEGAPGNIGSFCGWQIVKKYMKNNPGITPEQLMAKDAEQIFQETKYKP